MEKHSQKAGAARGFAPPGLGAQGPLELEQLGEEMVDRKASIVERTALRPRILWIEVARAHARAARDAAHQAERAERFEPVGVLKRAPERRFGHAAATEAVVDDGACDVFDLVR